MTARALIVAKAPVAGRVKTRLGRQVGMRPAADLAAAALLDTVDACAGAFPGRCHLALAGDLAAASNGPELLAALDGWDVFAQVGDTFGARLAHAHRQAAAAAGEVVVQVGMDTPQVTTELLVTVAALAATPDDAVLGRAADGGWWVLALRRAAAAAVLDGVPMSRSDTGRRTADALRAAGLRVVPAPGLTDVDTLADAESVAEIAPDTRFGRLWRTLEPAW